MAKLDSSKLLPSSKESSAIVKVDKPSVDIKEKKVNLASSLKPIDLKSSALSRDVVKDKKIDDAKDANNKLVKIEKFFKSDLLVSRKKAEEKRKEKEKQDFGEAEKKLEFPKLKGFQLPKLPSLPSLGIFERIKRFLFFTAIGWLLPKIIEFMPKLNGIIKVIGNVYQFAEGLFGKLFDGFMSLVKFGGDLKDKTIGFIANTRVGSSGNFQKEFDKLEKLFNTFTDAAIIAGLLAVDIGAAAFDEYNKWNRKNRPKPGEPTKPKEPRKPGKPPVTTGRGGQKGLGKGKKVKVTGGKKPSWWKGFIPKFKLPSWMEKIASRLQGGPFKKLAGPFKKFLGAAIPFAGSAIGELDARSRFASGDNVGGWLARTSAILDGFAGTTAVIGAGFLSSIIGAPVAAFLGAASGIATGISMAIDALLLVRDILNAFNIKTFSQGGKIFRKYQGGGTATRGGKPINAPKRRTITPAKRKPFIIKPPKSKPGKDVGGEDIIKNLYPDTGSKKPAASLQQWLAMGYAGTYKQYLDEIKRREGSNGSNDKKPNSYKALTSTAKILKEIPLIGGIMGAAVDVALGQKLDYKIIKSLSSGIGYLVESLANQRINLSVASLNREISSFSDGGYVSPSRELKKNYDSLSSGNLISKVIGPSIEQRVNEAIQSIQKELQKQRIKTDGAGGRLSEGRGSDGGGGEGVETIDMSGLTSEDVDALGRMIQAESGGESNIGKAAVMNVILNRYRLARAGKGYLPRGKTKDNVTIRDLLYAPSQFSPISDGRFGRTSSASGKSALAKAISAGGNDPQKLKRNLIESGLSEQDANYVVISSAFSNPKSRESRPFKTREVSVERHAFQESPYARLRGPGERIESRVRTSTAQVQALSSGFRTGLKTGPEGRIGAGTGYHIDARFMYNLPLKDKIAMLDSMAAAHAQEGYVMEFSGVGVAGERWNLNASPKEKEQLAKRVLVSHHSNRHPWQAFDYFAVKRIAKNRSDKSAEGANIMAPRISGGTYEYRVGGGYGRHLIIRDKNGREIFKVGHGDQGLPSPKEIGKIFKMDELQIPSQSQRPPQRPQKPKDNTGETLGNLMLLQQIRQRISNLAVGKPAITIPGVAVVRAVPQFSLGGLQLGKTIEYRSLTNPKQKLKPEEVNKLIETKLLGGKQIPPEVKFNSGGLIAPSKPNIPIPNSFASYETYGSGTMFAIQPILIPTSSGSSGSSGNKMIAFPIAISVNNSTEKLNLSRG